MPVSSSTEHWIKPDALTINLNHFGDPDYLQVSVLAGAVVMAFKQDVIGYNAAHNYRTWPLDAANTYLETTSAYNVYARLTRSEVNARALIVYDTVLRDIEGREITYAEDGSEVLGDANPDYFFVFLGQISASVNSVGDSIQREWVSSILFGTLNTNQFQNTESGGEWTKMFRLNKVTDLIDVLKTFSFAIFRKLSIKKGETEKIITDLKRSIDTDEDVPISDETIPTTKYLASVTDNRFLRKDKDDRSVGMIASDKGFEVGVFQQGELGSGGIFKIDEEGNSYLEVDKALFRKIAYFVEIMIKKLSHVGGSIILSHASMRCSKVETFATYYRCYFESEQEGKVIAQEFVVGDQARSQTFNIKEGLSQNVSNQYYWRLVVGVGDNYIDLSIADCDSGSGVPQAGDDIVLLGNRNDASRQNAIILSSYGEGTPSFRQYKGIKTYSLADAQMTTEFSPESNLIIGKFITESGKSIEDELGEVKVNWDKVLSQTDKEFTMWFFDYSPSADMLPESDWTTDDLKALHEEDLFYNTNVDHEDGGKAWRYVYDENLGKYVWEIVTDAETIKALEKASKANRRLDNIVSDGILSAAEKKEVLKEWEAITKAYEWNVYSSEKIGIEETSEEVIAYKDSYNTLGTYMNDGMSWEYGDGLPSILSRKDEDTPIVAEEYREVWTSYYTEETKLRNLLSEKAKGKADEVQEEIDNIVSDNILSSLEKKEVLKEWEAIVVSYAKNVDNASNNNVNHDDYTTAYYALGTYLNGGDDWDGTSTPLWLTDTSTNQEIDAEVYRSKWIDYYSKEVDLLATISDAIKTVADSKIRNFVSQPVPPYDEGDRWSNATYGDLFDDDDLVCVNPKADGESFSIEDWRPVAYGKTSVIKNMEGEIQLLAASFELGADGKYYLSKEAGVNITTEMASIYATKTQYNTLANKVASNTTRIDTTAKSLSAFTEKISFDSSGNVINISKSGLVTTDNYASIYSQYKDETGAVTQADLSTYVKKNSDGTIESGVKITGDNIKLEGTTTINGSFSVDTDGTTHIGGFTVTSNSLTNTSAGDNVTGASINISNSTGTRFARLNGGASGYAAEFRNDHDTAVYIQAYGSSSNYGLKIIGNKDSKAMYVTGSSFFITRQPNYEHTYISGLKICTRIGSSLYANYDSLDPYFPVGTNVDFLIASGPVTLPEPASARGRIIFVKRRGAGSSYLTVPNCYLSNGTYKSSAQWNDDDASRMFISDGIYWNEFACG